jgi:hypothetical protein
MAHIPHSLTILLLLWNDLCAHTVGFDAFFVPQNYRNKHSTRVFDTSVSFSVTCAPRTSLGEHLDKASRETPLVYSHSNVSRSDAHGK